MTLKKYGLVIYTNYGVRMGGVTYGPLVLIKPKYKEDRGLLEHELTHTKQFWNPLKWFKGKLWWEVEAYREQLKWYPYANQTERLQKAWLFAGFIATKYDLPVTQEEAFKLLTS